MATLAGKDLCFALTFCRPIPVQRLAAKIQRRRQGGAEGAQAPLSNKNIHVYFLVLHQHCKSRSGALQNVLWHYHMA